MKRAAFIIVSILLILTVMGLAFWTNFPRQSRDVVTETINQEPIEVYLYEPCPGAGEPRVEKLYKSLGDDLEKVKRQIREPGPLEGCPIPVRYELYP